MWWKEYADYRYDKPMKRETVETGKGIIGCEMHDVHGYGTTDHKSQYYRRGGVLTGLMTYLFGFKEEERDESDD